MGLYIRRLWVFIGQAVDLCWRISSSLKEIKYTKHNTEYNCDKHCPQSKPIGVFNFFLKNQFFGVVAWVSIGLIYGEDFWWFPSAAFGEYFTYLVHNIFWRRQLLGKRCDFSENRYFVNVIGPAVPATIEMIFYLVPHFINKKSIGIIIKVIFNFFAFHFSNQILNYYCPACGINPLLKW